MTVFYNEIDEYAADWLRNLIAAGHIAPGVVDSRSIVDIEPQELNAYTQCHFFAGIGVWSRALRMAQWPDSRRVWTGSCPCQPFSVAGAGAGVRDERHLWPHWFWLIEQCRPDVVLGEQVEAAIRHGWLDLVQSDMEGIGYAFAPVGLPAAGVGAPHIRARLWFVAERLADTGCALSIGRQNTSGPVEADAGHRQQGASDDQPCGGAGRLDHHHHQRLEGLGRGHSPEVGRDRAVRPVAEAGESGGVADAQHSEQRGRRGTGGEGGAGDEPGPESSGCGEAGALADPSGGQFPQAGRGEVGGTGQSGVGEEHQRPGPTNGHWRDADWIFCRDGKWRPIEPGTFPLAHGAPARVGRLRAYGNAIVAQVAAEVISAYMECAQ